MFLGVDLQLFFNNIYESYNLLPIEAKLIVGVVLLLIFIACILLIIMSEQERLNKKIVNKCVKKCDEDNFLAFDTTDIDEDNEKTRNLKEITDKIQAVLDNRNIDLTSFEQDQEEASIISYNELMKSVGKEPDKTKEAFSLPNLVHKIEVDEEFEETKPYIDPVKESTFKKSVFISPIFGIQDKEPSDIKPAVPETREANFKKEEFIEEETFLSNLRTFRKNLD